MKTERPRASGSPEGRNPGRRTERWIGPMLALAVAACYWPVTGHRFIYCDDPDYVWNNPNVMAGLSWRGVAWAFTTGHANNWHPATWLSHMLDCQLFGMWNGLHHLTSAGLHIANTLLLFGVLRRLTGAAWRSAFVAALFGLHPLHVESVAWVAERKDVLSAFFFLLTIWAYLKYVRSRNIEEDNCTDFDFGSCSEPSRAKGKSQAGHSSRFWFASALILFALGLMSKPMVVTLPFVLLLLDYWPLRRLKVEAAIPDTSPPSPKAALPAAGSRLSGQPLPDLVLEKLPFLILAAMSCVVTLMVQGQEGNVATLRTVPWGFRFGNALLSGAWYLEKMVWPTRLAAFYPLPHSLSAGPVILAVLVLGLVTVAACWQARRRPYLAVGWFWFCGTLLPVIGLVQVGLQARADRYSYLPFIGLFVALTWGVSDLAAGWRHRRAVLGGGAAVVIVACMTLTFHQVRLWKNTEILFQHALAVTTDNALAHQNLGAALAGQGKFEAAWPHFVEALRIWPDYPEAQSNLGYLLVEKGHWADAVRLFRAALKLRPRMAQTHYLLGRALSALGNRPESIAEFKTTLQLNPTHTLAMENLAWLLATDPDPLGGAGPEALRLAQQACRATASRDSQMLATLAAALARTGQFEEAARRMEQAIALPAAAGKPSLEAKYEQMLATFRAGKAWREDPPGTQP